MKHSKKGVYSPSSFVMQRALSRRKKNRFILVSVVILIIALAVIAGIFAYHTIINSRLSSTNSNAKEALVQSDSSSDQYTFLKIETGIASSTPIAYNIVENTRIYALVKTSSKDKTISIMTLPTNLALEATSNQTKPLCQVEEDGTDKDLIDAINQTFEIKVNHFIETTADASASLIQSVGGFDMDLSTTIDDPYSGNLTLNAGKVNVGKDETYTILRSKNISGTVEEKSNIIASFLKGAIEKLGSSSNTDLANYMADFAKETSTDLQAQNLIDFFLKAKSENYSYQDFCLTGQESTDSTTGKTLFNLYDSQSDVIIAKFKSEQESQQVIDQNTSINRANVHIEVRNGAGIAGAASSLKSQLESVGYAVDSATNAEQGVTYTETLVIYLDSQFESAANLVVRDLGCGRVVNGGDYYSSSSNVIVVIGSDWSGS